MESDKESLSISNLNGLIKQKRNADFKSVVSSVDRSILINMGGNTLMHTAATTSNIEIIAFLFSSGFDINAQNTLGQTPLHSALLNSNFYAVQLLLSLEPNIFISDSNGATALQICFQLHKSKVPEYIISCFLERLKRMGLPAQKVLDELVKVGCTLTQVVIINDIEVTGLMLDRRTSIDREESRFLLERSMTAYFCESVKAILRRGPGADERLSVFIDQVTEYKHLPKMKFYFEQIINWDLVNEDFLKKAQDAFSRLNEEGMQPFFDIGIDGYARKELGLELLVGLFGNAKVDAIKMIKNRQFNVNGRNTSGYTALHMAALNDEKASTVYLLENGADPNVKDNFGRTPLFVSYNEALTGLLLEAGADVQAIDNKGKTIVESTHNDRVVAELCILEARGLLKKEVADAMEKCQWRDKFMRSAIDSCREEIAWLKKRKISESISLFTLLVDTAENTARRVKSDEFDAIFEATSEREYMSPYDVMLTKKMNEAMELNELRSKAADFLRNVMKIDQADHLVIEKIIGFLTYRDLLVFDEIDIE